MGGVAPGVIPEPDGNNIYIKPAVAKIDPNPQEKYKALLQDAKEAATNKTNKASAQGSDNGNLANMRGGGYTSNAFEGLVDRVINDPEALRLLSRDPLFQQMFQQALDNRGQ